MSHLESIYLANVVLFFPSISVAQKFVMINKKCLDVLNIIRIFPVFEEDRWLFDFDQIVRFNKTKLLFPKAQTIHYSFLCCKYKELIPNSIQQYVITPEVQLTSNEFNRIKDIIVEYQTTTNDIVDVTDMKILRKINIECNTNNLEKFFVNKHKRIEYVKIVFTKMIDIKFLEHIKEYNFEKVVIFVCEKEELDKVVQIPNIFLFVTICFGWWYDGIHNNVVIINRYLFQNIEQNNVFMLCTNSTVNSNVVNSYYPYYVRLFHKNQQTWDDLDIGHAIETLYHNESSEEYDYDNSSDSSDDYKCYVRPIKEQNKVIPKVDLSIFTSIEEIEVMNKFECTFPTTITQLQSKRCVIIYMNYKI
ncbi:Leucine-rich repeat containing protein [Entamoeba marina]